MRKHMKRFMCMALAGALLVSNTNGVAPVAMAATEETTEEITTTDGTFTVTYDGVEVELTEYQGTVGVLDLAALAEEQSITITSIGERAFNNVDSLTKVILPDTVKVIGERAFTGCDQLSQCDLLEGLEAVGEQAFRGTALYAVTIPASCTSIGANAFYQCESLREVTFAERTKSLSVGRAVFASCILLQELEIPKTIASIPDHFCSGCTQLSKVTFEDGFEATSIGASAFRKCEMLEEITLPESVVSLGKEAFCLSGLEHITLPESCASIGKNAFSSCSNLQVAAFRNKAAVIGTDAFNGVHADFAIYGDEGGAVESYATGNGFRFNRFARSLRVQSAPTKMIYLYEEEFDVEGIEVIAELEPAIGSEEGTVTECKSVDVNQCVVRGYDSKKAGNQTIEVIYGGQKTTFDVKVYYDMTKAMVTLNDVTYTGSAQEPEVKVIGGETGSTLTKGSQYEVIYKNNTEAGTATVEITGKGLYKGTTSQEFSIFEKSVSDTDVKVAIESVTYDGSQKKPDPIVTYGDQTLTKGTDYIVTYGENVNAGTGTLSIEGKGNYNSAQWDLTFEIKPCEITSDMMEPIPTQTYTGMEIWPEVVMEASGVAMTQGEDYTVQYGTNKKAGKEAGTITLRGNGNYDGMLVVKFEILPASLSDALISEVEDYVYTGEEMKPEITVTRAGLPLEKGKDYDITYVNNVAPGTATIKVEGKGNYCDIITKTFRICPNIAEMDVMVETAPVIYDGTEKEPQVMVESGDVTLVEGTDFMVEYINNVNAGMATATVTGTGEYAGTKLVDFQIEPMDFSDLVRINPIPDMFLVGDAVTPDITVFANGVTLRRGIDYIPAYSENNRVGTAKVMISGCGNYSGMAEATFQIKASPQASAQPEPTLAPSENPSGGEATPAPGNAQPTTKPQPTVAPQEIVQPAPVSPTDSNVKKEPEATDAEEDEDEEIEVPDRVKSVSAKNKKKKTIAIKWKKMSNVSGYEVTIAKNKKFTKGKKLKRLKGTSYTFKKLDKKKYYVRVRAYVMNGTERVYGAYSKVKTVKVKK